ncbi:hypothetical protein BT96DRAFT_984675 [Gymnopus androsaceus JB14]|uniref:Uncharacterized protein n=1 Tax=Gymnopus androsaceus JB14 TaxID=1447944 RepID=A0A6A4IKC8_9AGAR|nr:hypothetical protein BT96DRAFT_984675 [Gymnopus androsaceus JB14]
MERPKKVFRVPKGDVGSNLLNEKRKSFTCIETGCMNLLNPQKRWKMCSSCRATRPEKRQEFQAHEGSTTRSGADAVVVGASGGSSNIISSFILIHTHIYRHIIQIHTRSHMHTILIHIRIIKTLQLSLQALQHLLRLHQIIIHNMYTLIRMGTNIRLASPRHLLLLSPPTQLVSSTSSASASSPATTKTKDGKDKKADETPISASVCSTNPFVPSADGASDSSNVAITSPPIINNADTRETEYAEVTKDRAVPPIFSRPIPRFSPTVPPPATLSFVPQPTKFIPVDGHGHASGSGGSNLTPATTTTVAATAIPARTETANESDHSSTNGNEASGDRMSIRALPPTPQSISVSTSTSPLVYTGMFHASKLPPLMPKGGTIVNLETGSNRRPVSRSVSAAPSRITFVSEPGAPTARAVTIGDASATPAPARRFKIKEMYTPTVTTAAMAMVQAQAQTQDSITGVMELGPGGTVDKAKTSSNGADEENVAEKTATATAASDGATDVAVVTEDKSSAPKVSKKRPSRAKKQKPNESEQVVVSAPPPPSYIPPGYAYPYNYLQPSRYYASYAPAPPSSNPVIPSSYPPASSSSTAISSSASGSSPSAPPTLTTTPYYPPPHPYVYAPGPSSSSIYPPYAYPYGGSYAAYSYSQYPGYPGYESPAYPGYASYSAVYGVPAARPQTEAPVKGGGNAEVGTTEEGSIASVASHSEARAGVKQVNSVAGSSAVTSNSDIVVAESTTSVAPERLCYTKSCRRVIPQNVTGNLCTRCRTRFKKHQSRTKHRFKLEPRRVTVGVPLKSNENGKGGDDEDAEIAISTKIRALFAIVGKYTKEVGQVAMELCKLNEEDIQGVEQDALDNAQELDVKLSWVTASVDLSNGSKAMHEIAWCKASEEECLLLQEEMCCIPITLEMQA